MHSEIFSKMSPTRLFFHCALPAMATSLAGGLYAIVDGIFVGRYLGADALAAVNIVMPLIMIVESLANMVAVGTSVHIATMLGKENRQEASRAFSFSVKFILLFSTMTAIIGFNYAETVAAWLAPGADEETLRLAVDYLKIYALFGPLIPIFFATDNYLRDCGRPKLSMGINILTQVLNMALDFLFIALLGWGIEGAALASCISIALGSIITLALFCGHRLDVYYTWENIPLAQFLRVLANGSSEFLTSIASAIMGLIMNIFLLKYGGTSAVAAFAIVMYVDSIIGMLNFGLCESLQPALSYCYGAGRKERLQAIFRRILLASLVMAVAAFLFMEFAGPYMARLFIQTEDQNLVEVSREAMAIFAFSYLAGWIDLCFSSYFTALDMPARSLMVSFLGTFVLPVVLLLVLTPVFGLTGIWLMAPIASALSGVATLLLYKSSRLAFDDLAHI